MKTKTIVMLLLVLVVVNAGLAGTIYFLLFPDAKVPVINVPVMEVPDIEVPKIEVPKIEVTEEDIDAVKENVKSKIYERAQLVEEEPSKEVDINVIDGEYVVDAWGLTFHLPNNVGKYNVTLKRDLLTIERHLQVLAYVVRYDTGVTPTIDGQWELLASYDGSDYYVRKGTSVVDEEFDKALDAERDELYSSILKTYHFVQE
ncbi:MAG: hypothetical protein ABS882_04740 [Lysinibacillus sp.]